TRCSRSPTRSASSRPTCWSLTPTPIPSIPTIRSPTPPSTGPAGWRPAPAPAVTRGRGLPAGGGPPSAFSPIRPPALFLFEPHQPELCNFMPTTHVDITSVMDQKRAAMAEMKAQAYLQTSSNQRADQRGHHARRAGGHMDVRQAESFMRVVPQVVEQL